MRVRLGVIAVLLTLAVAAVLLVSMVQAGRFLDTGSYLARVSNSARIEQLFNFSRAGRGWRSDPKYPVRISFPTTKMAGSGSITAQKQRALENQEMLGALNLDDPDISATEDDAQGEMDNYAGPTFAEMFRDLGALDSIRDQKPSANTEKKRIAAPKGVLASNFNLDSRRAAGRDIEIAKTIYANGIDKGKIPLRIVNDTTITVDARELAGKFDDKQAQSRLSTLVSSEGSSSFVDLDTLRSAGFDVRYDPIRDILVVEQGQS